VVPLPPLTKFPFPTFPGFPEPSETQSGTEPSQTWPVDWEVFPVETEVPEEGDDDDDDDDVFYVSCKLWFFSVCRSSLGRVPFNRPQQLLIISTDVH
jgi:chitinase